MRLGQLARKLVIKPAEIVDFLAAQNIQLEDEANTRIEDDHVALVMQKFAPYLPEQKVIESIIPETPIQPEEVSTVIEQLNLSPSSETLPFDEEETKIELIKAPKVELSGLKVLGKIDLPETIKKEAAPELPAEEPAVEAVKKPWQENERAYPKRRDRPNLPPRKNPIALQREREEREATKKRESELELEKEKRALHYRKKVKEAPPTKRIRLVDEPLEEFSDEALIEPPKTWWGKFMKWLNT